MAKRIKTTEVKETESVEEFDGEPLRKSARPSARRSVWPRRLFLCCLLLGGLLFFAPTIISSTPVWKSGIAWAAPQLAGKVEIGAVSLGWLSPVTLSQVTVLDIQGQPLARIGSVRTQNTLFALACNHKQLGTIVIDEPTARIVLRTDGSNVEDLLAELLTAQPQQPEQPPQSAAQGRLPQLDVQITRGSVELDDQIAGRKWKLENINASLAQSAGEKQPFTAKFSAALNPQGSPQEAAQPDAATQPSEIIAELSWTPSAPAAGQPAGLGDGKATCQLKGLALEAAEGALRRFAADVRPAGSISGVFTYEWADDLTGQQVTVRDMQAQALAVASPTFLGADRVQMELNNFGGQVTLDGTKITAKTVALDADLCKLTADGSLELPTKDLAGLLAALQNAEPGNEIQAAGEVNLAAILRQLPQTVHLRGDTEISSGKLEFNLASKTAEGIRRWDLDAGVRELIAQTAGRQVTLKQPVELAVTLKQSPQGPVIELFKLNSSFATAQGGGGLDRGDITLNADLTNLEAELSQFIDLSQARLAGLVEARLEWERGPQNQFGAKAQASIRQFQLQAGKLRPWQENDLQLAANFAGIADASGLKQLDEAQLTVVSGPDKLQADLLPRENGPPATLTSAAVGFSLQGKVETWLARIQPFVPMTGWQMAGGVDVQGSADVSPQRIIVSSTKVNLKQFAAQTKGLAIFEPVIKAETSGSWDQASATFQSPVTTFASSSLAFRADDLKAVLAPGGVAVTGLIDYRGDLSKLSAWLGEPGAPRTWQLGGAVVGRLEAAVKEGVVQAALTTDIENLAYATRVAPPAQRGGYAITPAAAAAAWQTAWVEPKVTLNGEATYDPAQDALQLSRATLESQAVNFSAAGTIQKLLGVCVTDLKGELACDMAGVTEKLRPLLGPTLEITGKENRQFFLKGPLFVSAPPSAGRGAAPPRALVANELTGEAGIGWQGAQFVGLVAGPAAVEAKIAQGVVEVVPLDIPLSEGRLSAAPKIHLNDPIPTLVMGSGKVIDQVRISPEICRGWLKFVAPLLADATQAEGKFSVDLEGAKIPLTQPLQSDVGGKLNIHQGKIGPGPLLNEYLGVIHKLEAIVEGKVFDPSAASATQGWVVLPEQNVDFRVVDGRVHHRGLLLSVRAFEISTEGSVGLDHSLQMTATFQVPQKWVAKYPALANVTSFQVPISGTINAPHPDLRGVEGMVKQLFGAAAQSLIQNKIGKAFGGKAQDLLKNPLQAGENLLQGGANNATGAVEKEVNQGKDLIQKELNRGLNKLFGPK